MGAVAFAGGMEVHAARLAEQAVPHRASIYYCVTGVEFPEFQPCRDRKDQRDI
jgi:hypothetical protein